MSNWQPADVIAVIASVAGVLIPSLVVLVRAIRGEAEKTRTEVHEATRAIEQHNVEARIRAGQKPENGDCP